MMLNALFDKAFVAILGWEPEEFRFLGSDGETNPNVPFSPFWGTVFWTIAYLTMVLVLRQVMKERKPIVFKWVMLFHNGMLSVTSLLLLILILENLTPLWAKGLWYSICTGELYPTFHKLQLLYYINYLFKYYELLDTVFILIGKKKLEFIHWYHHAATLWLTYVQIYGKSTMQWVAITLNLAVHVLMYYYFFMSSLGIQIWWKKYLTVFQIIQFLIDLVFCFYCSITFAMGEYYSDIFPGVYCNASIGAATVGSWVLTSYLILFVQFFFKTYNTPPRETKGTVIKKTQ